MNADCKTPFQTGDIVRVRRRGKRVRTAKVRRITPNGFLTTYNEEFGYRIYSPEECTLWYREDTNRHSPE